MLPWGRTARTPGPHPLVPTSPPLLPRADFYYELGVQLLEACLASRPLNGGLAELGALHAAVARRRGASADPVSTDDLRRAAERLAALGGGFAVVSIGGREYVRSVPEELSTDSNELIELAGRAGGRVSEALLAAELGWAPPRAAQALGAAMRQGLGWADDPPGGAPRLHWVPATGVEAAAGGYLEECRRQRQGPPP